MNRIRELRENMEMQQKELAIALKVSQPTISDWESGRKLPSAKSTMKLASFFKVSVEFLTGNSDALGNEKDSLWELRETLRRDPKRRMLFDAAANVNQKDIQTAVRLLDALKGNSEDGTD
jgi:transcriptional regulator with XRE-family HTH domain